MGISYHFFEDANERGEEIRTHMDRPSLWKVHVYDNVGYRWRLVHFSGVLWLKESPKGGFYCRVMNGGKPHSLLSPAPDSPADQARYEIPHEAVRVAVSYAQSVFEEMKELYLDSISDLT